MIRRQSLYWAVIGMIIGGSMLAGCTPSLSKKDEQVLESHNKPFQRNTDYRDALLRLGKIVNAGFGLAVDVFQVKTIENKTGGEGVPPDVTEMVISSVNTIAGDWLRVVPYDPDYIKQETEINTGGVVNEERTLPNFVITGAITEFDEAISMKNREISFDVWSPLQIEGRDLDPEIELAFDRAERVSRISVDFHLMDYQTLQFLPQMHVTNTILVVELEKGRSWGFKIYGSGPTISGRIAVRQGLQQAVRNVVDYSMAQLFGMYYSVPFWHVFSYDTGVRDQQLLSYWRQQFLRNYNRDTQIAHIQRWLAKYDLGVVYVGKTLQKNIPRAELGHFGSATQAFALKFLYQYTPRSALIPYVENGGFPQNSEALADLYMLLIEHIPL